jgi:hypothetical protein
VDLEQLKDDSTLCEDDNKDHIPQGFYFVSEGEYYNGTEGQIIVNLRDVVNLVNHTDPGRLNGCCGLDGCDGMNKLCENGHEVATEKSDCWLAHATLFDPQQVDMK